MNGRFDFGRVLQRAASLCAKLLKYAFWDMFWAWEIASLLPFLVAFMVSKAGDGDPLLLFGLGAVGIISYLVWLLFYGVLVVSGLKASNGDSCSLGEAMRSSLARFPTLFLVMMLKCVAIGLGLLCFIVPGVLFAVFFYLAPILVFTSDANAIECLRQSRALSSKCLGAVTAEVVLYYLVLVLFASGYVGCMRLADMYQSEWLALLLPELWCTVTSAVGIASALAVHTELSEPVLLSEPVELGESALPSESFEPSGSV